MPPFRAGIVSVIGFCIFGILSSRRRLEYPKVSVDAMVALPFIGHDLINPTSSKAHGDIESDNGSTASLQNGKGPITDKDDYQSFPKEKDFSSAPSGKIIRGSPVCKPTFEKHGSTTIKRIYFAHMRKAGGTTLREYLNQVTKKYKLEYTVKEATPIEYPGTRNDTLYVTHLRDPVSRTISHYKYSGRWDCKQLTANHTLFKPTEENAVGLEDWVERNECQTSRQGKIWECSTNCYIKWLNLEPNQKWCISEDNNIGSERFQMALTKAYGFNIIIDIHRLAKEASYVSKLEHFFALKGLTGLHTQPWCDEESKEANEKSPMGKIKNDTLEYLYNRNSADYKLRDKLINCKNDRMQFPSVSLTDFLG